MTSKPVGLRAKLEALRRDLVAIRFPGTFDEEAALLGKSRALIPVLQYLLGAGFSSVLASQFEDLQTSNRGVLSIRNFITLVFMFAREVLGMKMTITATQFMSEVRLSLIFFTSSTVYIRLSLKGGLFI